LNVNGISMSMSMSMNCVGLEFQYIDSFWLS
jgi:hypothetical protein